MSKNRQPRKLDKTVDQAVEDFSFELEEPFTGEEMGLEMLGLMVESSHNQLEVALGLTKIITDKNNINQSEQVLEIFKRALKTVNEHSPLKQMWEMVNK